MIFDKEQTVATIALAALVVGLALLLTSTNCSTCNGPIVRPDDTERCDEACAHLRDLGCPEGDDLEDGTTCEEWCVYTQDQGHALNPTCVETIQTCEQIEGCGE